MLTLDLARNLYSLALLGVGSVSSNSSLLIRLPLTQAQFWSLSEVTKLPSQEAPRTTSSQGISKLGPSNWELLRGPPLTGAPYSPGAVLEPE